MSKRKRWYRALKRSSEEQLRTWLIRDTNELAKLVSRESQTRCSTTWAMELSSRIGAMLKLQDKIDRKGEG